MKLRAAHLNAAAGLLGVFLASAGLALLLAPAHAASVFGLPPSAAQPLALRVAGIRELALGAVLIVLVAKREPRPIGLALLAMVIVPLGDCITVVAAQGMIPAAIPHALGVPGFLFLGWRLSASPTAS